MDLSEAYRYLHLLLRYLNLDRIRQVDSGRCILMKRTPECSRSTAIRAATQTSHRTPVFKFLQNILMVIRLRPFLSMVELIMQDPRCSKRR